jgi:hypothetical protein
LTKRDIDESGIGFDKPGLGENDKTATDEPKLDEAEVNQVNSSFMGFLGGSYNPETDKTTKKNYYVRPHTQIY